MIRKDKRYNKLKDIHAKLKDKYKSVNKNVKTLKSRIHNLEKTRMLAY